MHGCEILQLLLLLYIGSYCYYYFVFCCLSSLYFLFANIQKIIACFGRLQGIRIKQKTKNPNQRFFRQSCVWWNLFIHFIIYNFSSFSYFYFSSFAIFWFFCIRRIFLFFLFCIRKERLKKEWKNFMIANRVVARWMLQSF